MKITKLYKYPIKSLTPSNSESLTLNENGYIEGDRLFGFRFKDAGSRDDFEWQRKTNFAALYNLVTNLFDGVDDLSEQSFTFKTTNANTLTITATKKTNTSCTISITQTNKKPNVSNSC